MSKSFYRADIDGLRAIAVLLVVFYHADLFKVTGGYIGVDVFFVISGYLITYLTVNELDQNRFSFANFYARRVRRIFPALFAVFLGTVIGSFFLLFPQDFSNFGMAGRALAALTSNHEFLKRQNDYWEQTTLTNQPLLHTWSLAIEEQFYLFFPLLLFLLYRIFRKSDGHINKALLAGILAVVAVVSFAANIHLVSRAQALTFYVLPTRAWELLMGSILAVVGSRGDFQMNRALRQGLGLLGLALVGSAFVLSEGSVFPGWNAIFPCLGAVFLIMAGTTDRSKNSWVSKLLATTPFVFVGKISYSLYLWHWPLLVFIKSPYWVYWGNEIPLWAYFVAIFVLSILSWRFVEEPFRRGRFATASSKAYLVGGLVTLVLMNWVSRYVIVIGDGKSVVRQIVPPELENLLPTGDNVPFRVWESPTEDFVEGKATKMFGRTDVAEPTVAILGDSNASMWGPAFEIEASKHSKMGWMLARQACPALDGLEAVSEPECDDVNERRLKQVEESDVRWVVLSASWFAVKYGGGPGYYLRGEDPRQKDDEFRTDEESLLSRALVRTIERLKNSQKRIVLVLPVPADPIPSIAHERTIASLRRNGADIYGWKKDEHDRRPEVIQIRNLFAKMRERYGVYVIDPAKYLCDPQGCWVARQAKPIYHDGSHLAQLGNELASPMFRFLFE